MYSLDELIGDIQHVLATRFPQADFACLVIHSPGVPDAVIPVRPLTDRSMEQVVASIGPEITRLRPGTMFAQLLLDSGPCTTPEVTAIPLALAH